VLLAADALAGLLALALVEVLFIRTFQVEDIGIFALVIPGIGAWALLTRVYGLDDGDRLSIGRSVVDDLPHLLLLSIFATWGGLLFLHLSGIAQPQLRNAEAFWLFYLVLLIVARSIGRPVLRRIVSLREPTLVVGAGVVGRLISTKLVHRPAYGLDIVGFVDDDPLPGAEGDPPRLGGTHDLERVVRANDVKRVILAFTRQPAEEQVDLCRRCLELGLQVDIVPRMFEVIGTHHRLHSLDGLPLLGLRSQRLSRTARLAKRALDLAVASVALFALAPFFAYCAFRIKRESPGPVFFRQERMGVGGKRFHIFKFRTMVADADAQKHTVAHLNKHLGSDPRMFKIPDDPRITPFGTFLRRWSLDEIPQLVNVVRGEMSLVGPRPLILDEDEHIRGRRRNRLSLTPGITGLWQVLGRSEIPFAEMVTLDYLYVTNWSLWGDVKLLCRTLPVVIQRRGAY
jgi:exopolysaccharide biosynthesis polyprenyl glycosylphosphotransferase